MRPKDRRPVVAPPRAPVGPLLSSSMSNPQSPVPPGARGNAPRGSGGQEPTKDAAEESREGEEIPRSAARGRRRAPALVVGLGSSAGGVQALKAFFRGLPDDPDMAFVVVVHLDPDRDSRLADVLRPDTRMKVVQVTDSVPLRRGEVYVIPPGRGLVLSDGRVSTAAFEHSCWQRAPIDIFFRSLADLGPRAAAVVLSGTGTDGTLGVRAVQEAGGLVLVQDPTDAEYEGMPTSALRGGHADMVLPASELGTELFRLAERRARERVSSEEALGEEDEEALRRILDQLRARTGHEFGRYKRSTVLRRIRRRMDVNQVGTLPQYLDVLRKNVGEAPLLLRDLLIRVTSFFRDPEVWAAFERDIVPRLFERRAPEETLRVWVPACATGEEAYTIAMLLLAHASKLERAPEILVFASDLDEDAVSFGRAGLYPAAIAADVPDPYLERFFNTEDGAYRVAPEVRGHVVFAAHSIFRNPPFSRLDLISCRNLLIYLERDLQADALRVFHYALRPRGILVLGTAEAVDAAAGLFEAIDSEHRIFRRADTVTAHPPPVARLHRVGARTHDTGGPGRGGGPDLYVPASRRHEKLLEELAPPSLVVDRSYGIVHLSGSAGRFLRRPGGVPSNDPLVEIVPDLRAELREALADAFQNGRPTSRGPIHVAHGDEGEWIHLIVKPGGGAVETRDHALVLFVEAGAAPVRPPAELEAVNRELTAKLQEISQSNSDLRSLMAATQVGALFLDQDLRIQRFTPSMSDVFRIGAADEGRPITDFAHGLDYADLAVDARKALSEPTPIEHEVAGPGGKWYLLTLRPYRTEEDAIAGVMITMVDITRRKEAEEGLIALTEDLEQQVEERTEKLKSALDLFQSLFHVSPAPIAITRCSDGRLMDYNRAYQDLLASGVDDSGEGHHVAGEHWADDAQRLAVLGELRREGRVRDIEVQLTTSSGERRIALTFAKRLEIAGEPHELWVFIDITARKEAEAQVRALASKLTIAEQQERSRVARVLHEDLQQRLYSARYKLEVIRGRAKVSADATEALASLSEVEGWLDEAIEEMRRLSVDLSPPVLEGEGLTETLGWLVAQMNEVHGLEVSLVVDKRHRVGQPDQRVMMFQIVRALLLNVVEHAGVDRATIRLRERGDVWVIEVEDEGVGFDPGILENGGGKGYGLPYLRERVGLFGGRLTLDTAPGRGTRVTILLPKAEERDQ